MSEGFLDRLRTQLFGRPLIQSPDSKIQSAAPIEVRIGIDYGTRFTKVAVGREGLQSTIWSDAKGRRLIPSVVHVTAKGDVLPWPDDAPSGAIKVEYLKMLLASPQDERFDSQLPLPQGPQRERAINALAALYLAETIRRVRQSEETKPYLKNRTIRWLVNIGVPVQYYDAPERKIFQEVASVAYRWHEAPPSGSNVESLVNAYLSVVAENAHIATSISAFPELAAALSEYIRDPNRPEGLYGFCDIGGGTIDGAMFRLNRVAGLPRLAILSAAVAPLGTVAVARDLVQRLSINISEQMLASLSQQVEMMLFNSKQLSDAAKDVATQLFTARDVAVKDAVQTFIRTFVNEARLKQYVGGQTFSDTSSGKKIRLRMFLAGGGAASPWYRSAIQGLDPKREPAFDGIETVRLETVTRPSGYRGEDFSRFVIAFGLAGSPEELEETSQFLPSQIPKKSPLPEGPARSSITKDQM